MFSKKISKTETPKWPQLIVAPHHNGCWDVVARALCFV